jgi:hypothetical protein
LNRGGAFSRVITIRTPGAFTAALVSIDAMLPRAIVLVTGTA